MVCFFAVVGLCLSLLFFFFFARSCEANKQTKPDCDLQVDCRNVTNVSTNYLQWSKADTAPIDLLLLSLLLLLLSLWWSWRTWMGWRWCRAWITIQSRPRSRFDTGMSVCEKLLSAPPGPRFAASHSLSLTPSVCANSMPDVIKAWATDRLTPVVASLCELASIDSHDNVSILENPVSLVGSALLWIQANLLLSCTSFLTDAANPLLLTHTHTRIHMHVPSS